MKGNKMKELFVYILGCFSGIFLMCCLQVIEKDTKEIKKEDKRHNKLDA